MVKSQDLRALRCAANPQAASAQARRVAMALIVGWCGHCGSGYTSKSGKAGVINARHPVPLMAFAGLPHHLLSYVMGMSLFRALQIAVIAVLLAAASSSTVLA